MLTKTSSDRHLASVHVPRWLSHTRTGVAVLITGPVIYAAGSVLLARPHVSRPVTLFIAVPVAAVAGMAVLGALTLVVAFLISALNGPLDANIGGSGGGHGRTRRWGRGPRIRWPWFSYL